MLRSCVLAVRTQYEYLFVNLKEIWYRTSHKIGTNNTEITMLTIILVTRNGGEFVITELEELKIVYH